MISLPTFTEDNIRILEQLDDDFLDESIAFLRNQHFVFWKNNDTGEIVPEHKLPRELHKQPTPQYPRELTKIGGILGSIAPQNTFEILKEEGFFTKGSFARREQPGTLYSPTLICARIADACKREHLCDGLLGNGIRNGLYLKC